MWPYIDHLPLDHSLASSTSLFLLRIITQPVSILRPPWKDKDVSRFKEVLTLGWDEKGCFHLALPMQNLPVGGGRTRGSWQTSTRVTHTLVEMGHDNHGFRNMTT